MNREEFDKILRITKVALSVMILNAPEEGIERKTFSIRIPDEFLKQVRDYCNLFANSSAIEEIESLFIETLIIEGSLRIIEKHREKALVDTRDLMSILNKRSQDEEGR